MRPKSKTIPCGGLVGKKFGRLLVEKEEKIFKTDKSRIFATCKCDCGGTKICERYGLVSGKTTSCGCLKREQIIAFNKTKKKPPGTLKIDDPRTAMLYSARHRAKKKGLPFTITIDDIVIPETCPLLGIEIVPFIGKTNGKNDPRSPSLDQIIPGKGYTPDNIQVVSYRGNVLKWNASIEELEMLVENLKIHSALW